MNGRQIALVQESWAHLEPRGGEAARLFYERLFRVAPSVRPLFSGDLETHFTPELRRAWTDAYGVLATAMQQAATADPAPAPPAKVAPEVLSG